MMHRNVEYHPSDWRLLGGIPPYWRGKKLNALRVATIVANASKSDG